MDHILYQVFMVNLNIYIYIYKKHDESTDNPAIIIYVNKMGNRITIQVNARYFLELLTLEVMKLLGISKNKITKDEYGEKNLKISS